MPTNRIAAFLDQILGTNGPTCSRGVPGWANRMKVSGGAKSIERGRPDRPPVLDGLPEESERESVERQHKSTVIDSMLQGRPSVAAPQDMDLQRLGPHRHGGPVGQGSLLGAVRMDPAQSYKDVPEMLAAYIQSGETKADLWSAIRQRIDYTYDHLKEALLPVLLEHPSDSSLRSRYDQIRAGVREGKRLLFKANLIDPTVLDLMQNGKPGPGEKAATDWTVVAATMRFFRDFVGIKYCEMAIADAGTFSSVYSVLLSKLLGVDCPPEAIMEGRIVRNGAVVGYGGFPGYFIRKYLFDSSARSSLATDNPMSGYRESLAGTFLPPGQARGKLMMYDLNNAENACPGSRPSRGRLVRVPGTACNYVNGVVIHKVVAGDPQDHDNYPGAVIINMAKLKIHCWQIVTNALKNIGVGVWPMLATGNLDSHISDWLYSGPVGEFPPAVKGCGREGAFHSVHYSTNTDLGKPPIVPGQPPLPSNMGLDGTIADMCLAVRSVAPVQLHITDAIQVINESHTGDGVKVDEGFVFASADPVALDLFCARYLFKTVSLSDAKEFGKGLGHGFAVEDAVPYYDAEAKKILSKREYDSPVSRETLFTLCHKLGLGSNEYRVLGRDVVNDQMLAVQEGHLGTVHHGVFKEVVTQARYFHKWGMWWDVQKVALSYLKASDEMTGSSDLNYFMSELDGSGLSREPDGVLDYSELGFHGATDAALSCWIRAYHDIALGNANHGMFYFYQKLLKWSRAGWNEFGYDGLRPFKDSMSILTGMIATHRDGEWPSFHDAMDSWHDTLVAGMSCYASKTGRPFELYVPREYLLKDVEGLVVIDESDPAFATRVFTAQFMDTREVW